MDFGYAHLAQISDRAGISPRRTEEFLEHVYKHSSDRPKKIEVQRTLGMPTSVMASLHDHLYDVVSYEGDRMYVTEGGMQYIDDMKRHRSMKDSEIQQLLPKVTSEIEQLEGNMHKPKKGIDQTRATAETVSKRIGFLYERGLLEGRAVMLMGDNDIMSIGLAMTGLPARITVFDIDRDLICFINDVKKVKGLDIECSRYDARNTFSENLAHKYDISITDPPYTPAGFDLFIRRCVKGIKPDSGVVAISYGYSDRSRERALPIQGIIIKHGLVIEEIAPLLNRYFSAQLIGCQSSFYVCRTTPQTNDDMVESGSGGPLYTARKGPWKKSKRDHLPKSMRGLPFTHMSRW